MAGAGHGAAPALGSRLARHAGPIFPDWHMAGEMQNVYADLVRAGVSDDRIAGALCGVPGVIETGPQKTLDNVAWPASVRYRHKDDDTSGIMVLLPERKPQSGQKLYIAAYIEGQLGSSDVYELMHAMDAALRKLRASL